MLALQALELFVLGVMTSGATESVPSPRPWTLLVYGAADNNADGPLQEFLDSVRKAIDDDPGIDVLLLIDRSTEYDNGTQLFGEGFSGTRLYRLTKDRAERLSGGEQIPEIVLDSDVELDSADPRLLRRFVQWGKAVSPSKQSALMIYSHASGESMCPDDASNHVMGIPALTKCDAPIAHVDFLALELCNMGGIEIAYEWSPERPGDPGFSADVLVAIPNAGPPLDWDRAFARIRSPGHATSAQGEALDPASMTAGEFGRLVVEEGRDGRLAASKAGRQVDLEAAACYDLKLAPNVKQIVDEFARALAKSDAKSIVMPFRSGGERLACNYSEGGPYVDLADFARCVKNCPDVASEARDSAEAVLEVVDAFVIASFGMSGLKGFQPDQDGVFIVLPAPIGGAFRQFGWYSPTPDDKGGLAGWAFLRDGATPSNDEVENWFELVDSWLDVDDGEGGSNHYQP